jgi:hypothetical protein
MWALGMRGPKPSSETILLGMVAHTFNLSYSGGGDQEDLGLMLAQAKSYQDPHLNK